LDSKISYISKSIPLNGGFVVNITGGGSLIVILGVGLGVVLAGR
jgi:hypothetical protein